MMKRKTTLLSTVVLSATATFLASPSVATATQLADSLSTHRLEEVQVTATRASAKTPMSFSNVSKGQLLKSNLGQDVPYLLLQTPSVVATSEPGIGIGYTYLHTAIDGFSRLAYTEALDDEKASTTIGFFCRARAFFAAHGISLRTVRQEEGTEKNARLLVMTHEAKESDLAATVETLKDTPSVIKVNSVIRMVGE